MPKRNVVSPNVHRWRSSGTAGAVFPACDLISPSEVLTRRVEMVPRLPLTTDSTFILFPGETTEFLFAADSQLPPVSVPCAQVGERLQQLTCCSTGALPRLHRVYRPHDPVARQRLRKLYEAVCGEHGNDA